MVPCDQSRNPPLRNFPSKYPRKTLVVSVVGLLEAICGESVAAASQFRTDLIQSKPIYRYNLFNYLALEYTQR